MCAVVDRLHTTVLCAEVHAKWLKLTQHCAIPAPKYSVCGNKLLPRDFCFVYTQFATIRG